MIRFHTHKKHQKNTRHQKYQKIVLNLFIYFFMIRFYTHKKHQKNTRHQKALKVQKHNQAKAQKCKQANKN